MPNIDVIELMAFEFSISPEMAYGMARGLNFRRNCSLFKIIATDGTVGYGEAAGPPALLRQHLALLRPFFVNRSIYDFEIVAAQIYNRLYHFGVQNLLTACLGGISIALHDLMGKWLNIPAHNLLGGKSRDRFGCYAGTGYFTKSPLNAFEMQLEKVVERKFTGAKIKIGGGPASDLDRVRTARAILGDDILLMVDINGNYTPDIALETIRRIQPYNIHWCEEPLPPTDVRGYAEVRTRSPIPIAAGEAFYTVHDFKRIVDAGGLDILQPAITSCGGFGQAKAIAMLAMINNLRIYPSVWANGLTMAASLHFAASLPVTPHTDHVPYPMLIEYDTGENPFRDEMLSQPLEMIAGEIPVPTGPGLGVEIDLGAIEKYALG